MHVTTTMTTSNRGIRVCGWLTVAFLLLLAIGWVAISNFIPPVEVSADASVVADFYREHRDRIQLGYVVTMLAISLWACFAAGLSALVRKIDTGDQIMARIVQSVMTAIVALFYVLITIWATAGFRPERAPEITQIFNDFGWMFMIWIVSITMVIWIPMGAMVLRDQSSTPLLPRWYGYYCFSEALVSSVGIFSNYFKTGPFAYDGILAFWLGMALFMSWCVITAVLMTRVRDLPVRA